MFTKMYLFEELHIDNICIRKRIDDIEKIKHIVYEFKDTRLLSYNSFIKVLLKDNASIKTEGSIIYINHHTNKSNARDMLSLIKFYKDNIEKVYLNKIVFSIEKMSDSEIYDFLEYYTSETMKIRETSMFHKHWRGYKYGGKLYKMDNIEKNFLINDFIFIISNKFCGFWGKNIANKRFLISNKTNTIHFVEYNVFEEVNELHVYIPEHILRRGEHSVFLPYYTLESIIPVNKNNVILKNRLEYMFFNSEFLPLIPSKIDIPFNENKIELLININV